MRLLLLAAAIVSLALGGAASAQSSDPAEAAEYILNNVCLPLYDGQAVTPQRLSQVAGGQGLTEREGRWLARLGAEHGLIVTWTDSNRTCQITAVGTPLIAEALIVRMQAAGWHSAQQRQPVVEGGVADILCIRAPDDTTNLCAVVHRREPQEAGSVAMTLTLIRAP